MILYSNIFNRIGPQLNYQDMIDILSDVPQRSLPEAPTTVLAWHPPAASGPVARVRLTPTSSSEPVPSTSFQPNEEAEEAQASQTTATSANQNCQVRFLSSDDRIKAAAKLENLCIVCDKRTGSFCFPYCTLSNVKTKQFYCVNGVRGRNCFQQKHEKSQPKNHIPIHVDTGYAQHCSKCKVGQTRFSCNQCNEPFCFLNGKPCFYSSAHLEKCKID